MPTYVYKFVDTGETIEVQQAFADATLTEIAHPDSGEVLAVKKVFTPVGVTFKGSGFFKTDNRGKKSASEVGSKSGDSKTESKSSESSSDSKSGDSKSGDSKSGDSKSGDSTKKSATTSDSTSNSTSTTPTKSATTTSS